MVTFRSLITSMVNKLNDRRFVEAATMSRGSMASRMKFDMMAESCADEEMAAVYRSYRKERDDV